MTKYQRLESAEFAVQQLRHALLTLAVLGGETELVMLNQVHDEIFMEWGWDNGRQCACLQRAIENVMEAIVIEDERFQKLGEQHNESRVNTRHGT